jgi:hypothetical protein
MKKINNEKLKMAAIQAMKSWQRKQRIGVMANVAS